MTRLLVLLLRLLIPALRPRRHRPKLPLPLLLVTLLALLPKPTKLPKLPPLLMLMLRRRRRRRALHILIAHGRRRRGAGRGAADDGGLVVAGGGAVGDGAVAVLGFGVAGGVVGWLLVVLWGELGHVRVAAVVGVGWRLLLMMLGAGCSGGGVCLLLLLVHAHQQPDAEADEAESGDAADHAAYDGADVGGGVGGGRGRGRGGGAVVSGGLGRGGLVRGGAARVGGGCARFCWCGRVPNLACAAGYRAAEQGVAGELFVSVAMCVAMRVGGAPAVRWVSAGLYDLGLGANLPPQSEAVVRGEALAVRRV